MEKGLHNIIAAIETVTVLIPEESGRGAVSSIKLTNSSTAIVEVDLYLEDYNAADNSENPTHIVKTDIPAKTSLVLDDDMSFNNSVLSLVIKTTGAQITAATPLSIIIK
jgi:hypothetical protein